MEPKTPKNDSDYLFGKKQAVFILAVVSILNMINMMDRTLFAVAQEPMRIALGLNDTQIGLFQTIFWLGLSLMTLPIAFLCDRWSRKKMLGILAIMWSVFTFLTGLGKNFITVLIPRLFVGIGESGFTSGGQALLVRSFPLRLRGSVLAIFHVVSNLGNPLGMALGGYIIVKYSSWSMPFFFFAIPGIIFGIMAFSLKDYKTVPPPVKSDGVTKESFLASVIALFKIRTLLWVYLAYAAICIVLQSVLAWLPTFLMRSHNIKADKAGLLVGIIGLLGLVGATLGGIVSDKWQKKNPRARMLFCAISAVVATVSIICGVLLDMKGIGFAFTCLWAVATLSALAPNAAVTQDCSPLDKRGQAWGVNNLLAFFLGPGVAPFVVGALSDRLGAGAYGLKMALLSMSIFGFVSAILYAMGVKYYEADVAKVGEADKLKGLNE